MILSLVVRVHWVISVLRNTYLSDKIPHRVWQNFIHCGFLNFIILLSAYSPTSAANVSSWQVKITA